jgi:tRNA nucleotidyltransferase/poly(A) polymerase
MKLKELLNEINKVHQEVNTSKPYICGGVVRDKYMNRLSKIADLDITTGDKSIDILGEQFYNNFKNKFKIRTEVAKDGHRTIKFGNLKIDFSSNYIQPNIENIVGKKLTLLEQETFSRDFTCNALISDLDLTNIKDITGKSFIDIKNKIVDTCLVPEQTFIQKNRAIRSIYLAIKLDFGIHNRVIEYLSKYPIMIQNSSMAGLKEKLDYCLANDKDKALYYLKKTKMINFIPPGITDA